MAKIRVHQLAKKWKVDSNQLLEELNNRGHKTECLLSSVEESKLDFKPSDVKKKKLKISAQKSAMPVASGPPEFRDETRVQRPMDRSRKENPALTTAALVFAMIAFFISVAALVQLRDMNEKNQELSMIPDQVSVLEEKIEKELAENPEKLNAVNNLRVQRDVLRELSLKSEGDEKERLDQLGEAIGKLLEEMGDGL